MLCRMVIDTLVAARWERSRRIRCTLEPQQLRALIHQEQEGEWAYGEFLDQWQPWSVYGETPPSVANLQMRCSLINFFSGHQRTPKLWLELSRNDSCGRHSLILKPIGVDALSVLVSVLVSEEATAAITSALCLLSRPLSILGHRWTAAPPL